MKELTIEELNKVLKDHKLWLDTGGEEGKKADLQKADFREADFREASLREANLQGADLREADLLGADLQGANMQGANLRGADLWTANLRGADLQGANLEEVDLEEVYLIEADLRETNLREANLGGANLKGANLKGANLKGANLSKVRSFWNCLGERKRIKNISLNSDRYKICYTSTHLQIGCKLFLISDWEKFSDEKIISFDESNPQVGFAWWKENKDEIFQTIKEDPAE